MKSRLISGIERVVFAHRGLIVAAFAVMSLFMCYEAAQLRVDAGFEKLLPMTHPYMRTFVKYQEEFGGANRVLIAVRARQGDIFNPEVFKAIKAVTDEVFFLPGINRSTVQSIFTPNVRFTEIVEGGFAGGNVIPADFQPTPEGLAEVRENILKAGIVGRLVAKDFTAALVTAQLVEIDPTTGQRLDYFKVARLLEDNIRGKFQDDRIDIHIIGFAKMIGDIADGAAGVVLFFLVAFVITAFIVYAFTRSARLTSVLLFCSVLAVVWDVGLFHLLGFGLDPMSILVPFLVFAIGVSHGLQMVNAVRAQLVLGDDALGAARAAFRNLVIPGGVALATDSIGFLTILLIRIRIVQETALIAGLGVCMIVLTNLLLLPILLSYVPVKDRYRARLARRSALQEWLWQRLGAIAAFRPALVIIGIAAVLLAFGVTEAPQVKIGDLHAGVPELHADSRYNRDTAVVTSKFNIGVDILTTIVETVPDACIQHDVMAMIDNFQWHLANVPGVQSTLSMPQVAKIVNAGWNEGSLKWRVLPRNTQTMVQAVSGIETSTGLLNRDCSVMPVLAFMEDHKADTIERVVAAVKEFAAEHDSDRHRFRLATGNVGVMAGTNEVVSAAQFGILFWIYATTIALSLIAFRSPRAAFCIITPLCLVSLLCNALMSVMEIGLKVSTLPVAALGVGIGVDYGVYLFSRMQPVLQRGGTVREAYDAALRVTGAAVLLTGLTLGMSVATWVFSALKFQADMGLLLSFMFIANMLGAMLLLPALAVFVFRPRRPAPESASS